MITTITLNPAVDRMLTVPHMALDAVNRVTATVDKPGGKGINVAMALSHWGEPVSATGFLGGESGAWIAGRLARCGINVEMVTTETTTRTNIKIVDPLRETITDLNESGELVRNANVAILCEKVRFLSKQSRFVIASGSLPPGVSSDIYQEIIRIGNEAGTKCILDCDGEALRKGIEAAPFCIKPNIHEIESTFGVSLKGLDAIASFCREAILPKGVEIVIVSMGAEGTLLVSGEETLFAEPIAVPVKNTVGAGDSIVAGFVYGKCNGLPMESSLRIAAAAATLCVERGGVINAYDDVRKMTERVQITKM